MLMSNTIHVAFDVIECDTIDHRAAGTGSWSQRVRLTCSTVRCGRGSTAGVVGLLRRGIGRISDFGFYLPHGYMSINGYFQLELK